MPYLFIKICFFKPSSLTNSPLLNKFFLPPIGYFLSPFFYYFDQKYKNMLHFFISRQFFVSKNFYIGITRESTYKKERKMVDKISGPITTKVEKTQIYKDPQTGTEYLISQNNEQKKQNKYSVFGDNGHKYEYSFGVDKGLNKPTVEGNTVGSVSIGTQSDYNEAKSIWDNLVLPNHLAKTVPNPTKEQLEKARSEIELSRYR